MLHWALLDIEKWIVEVFLASCTIMLAGNTVVSKCSYATSI